MNFSLQIFIYIYVCIYVFNMKYENRLEYNL